MNKDFFGHPRGLSTLFFTEMWERFSYYGMRALLFLYMVTAVSKGGLGYDEKTSAALYGLYTMLVYLMALPGGWLADKLFGLRNAVFYGGCIIALGHGCIALNNVNAFFIGLLLIVIGTGLLKPNISSLVGQLYPGDEGARRDAGFSIFFLGINIGAFVSPFITGYLGETVAWHYGFAVAGIGMVVGLIQFKLTERYLGDTGKLSSDVNDSERTLAKRVLVVVVIVLTVFVLLLSTEVMSINPVVLANYSAIIIILCTTLYFGYLLFFAGMTEAERRNVAMIAIYFVAAIVFYMGYEQQGSSLNLFAKRYTNMFIGEFEMPASWLQTVPPVSVIIFAPLGAWLWVKLSERGTNPTTTAKLSFGLIFVGVSYILMSGAALLLVGGEKPLPTWLIGTYLLHTFGEICLYPVGLSAVTKLAPRKYSGQMMGVWFLSLSLGNLLAGLVAGRMDENEISAEPMMLVHLFLMISAIVLICGVGVFFLQKPLKKLQTSQ